MSGISCDEGLHEIEHYLHGELDQVRSHSLAEHLEGCGHCLERAEFQRKLKEIIRAKCRSDAPADLVWRVRMSLREVRITGPDEPQGEV